LEAIFNDFFIVLASGNDSKIELFSHGFQKRRNNVKVNKTLRGRMNFEGRLLKKHEKTTQNRYQNAFEENIEKKTKKKRFWPPFWHPKTSKIRRAACSARRVKSYRIFYLH